MQNGHIGKDAREKLRQVVLANNLSAAEQLIKEDWEAYYDLFLNEDDILYLNALLREAAKDECNNMGLWLVSLGADPNHYFDNLYFIDYLLLIDNFEFYRRLRYKFNYACYAISKYPIDNIRNPSINVSRISEHGYLELSRIPKDHDARRRSEERIKPFNLAVYRRIIFFSRFCHWLHKNEKTAYLLLLNNARAKYCDAEPDVDVWVTHIFRRPAFSTSHIIKLYSNADYYRGLAVPSYYLQRAIDFLQLAASGYFYSPDTNVRELLSQRIFEFSTDKHSQTRLLSVLKFMQRHDLALDIFRFCSLWLGTACLQLAGLEQIITDWENRKWVFYAGVILLASAAPLLLPSLILMLVRPFALGLYDYNTQVGAQINSAYTNTLLLDLATTRGYMPRFCAERNKATTKAIISFGDPVNENEEDETHITVKSILRTRSL